MSKIWLYFFNILLSVDRFANSVLGGSPEMTISGRMGRDIAENKCALCKPICAVLNWMQSNHCAKVAAEEAIFGSDAVDKHD